MNWSATPLNQVPLFFQYHLFWNPSLRIPVVRCCQCSKSEYRPTCFTDCHKILPCPNFCLPDPFTFIKTKMFLGICSLIFYSSFGQVSCVSQQNKIGHPNHCHKGFKQAPTECLEIINWHQWPKRVTVHRWRLVFNIVTMTYTNLCFSTLCMELVWMNFENVICSEVTLSSYLGTKVQVLAFLHISM